MKTFATLALLGFASAIKLQSEQGPIVIDKITKELAANIMTMCDTDLDGKCTVDENEAAFSEYLNSDDPF